MARNYRELKVFTLADNLVVDVYRATEQFESSERFGLRAQLRRAAASVPINIVEGASRDTEGEYLRFLDIAFGSCREVAYLLDLSHRLGYIDDATVRSLSDRAERTAATLYMLRRALRATPSRSRQEWRGAEGQCATSRTLSRNP